MSTGLKLTTIPKIAKSEDVCRKNPNDQNRMEFL
jgi:hypothetical protein